MTKEIDKLIDKFLDIAEELYNFASSDDASSSDFEKLSKLSDAYILTAVALNPKTPIEILIKLYEHYDGIGGTDEEMRVHIVNNPALTNKLLEDYSENDKSVVVQKAAAKALELKIREEKS